MKKVFEKIGLSWHDAFIIIALLETSWWIMFAFVDGADVVLRMAYQPTHYTYHTYLLVHKFISFIKLCLAIGCIWYGTVIRGKGLWLRFYVGIGVLIDVGMVLAWVLIAIEEEWPLGPYNLYGMHYVITFVAIRSGVYWIIWLFMNEIFVLPFGSTVVAHVNGVVVGIQDSTINSADNLVFLGKGVIPLLKYYANEAQRSALILLIWDILWTTSIIITQELPELIFDVIFIGMFGCLPLYLPTENMMMRVCRVLLSTFAIWAVVKKHEWAVKTWMVLYAILIIANITFFCYFMTNIVSDDTSLAVFILTVVFFVSNGTKFTVLYFVMRFYVTMNSDVIGFIHHVDE